MAGLVEKLPEGGSFLGNAALQSPLAHAQFFGDHEEVGPTAGQQSPQNPLHLLKDALSRATLLQLIVELGCEHLQEFIVVRDEGKLQVRSAQNQRIARGAIFHPAAKVFLEAILPFSRPREFDALGIQPRPRAAAAEFRHEREDRIDQ